MCSKDYKTELDKNGVLAFVPGGTSMWPTLKHAKQSVIVLLKTERLKEMDVALYLRKDGKYVLHRVIKVLQDGYVFTGDSLDFTETVLENEVVGVMVGFYRKKKYVDVLDEKYIEQVKKLYSNDKKRIKRANAYKKRKVFLHRIKRIITFDFKRR